MHFGRIKAALHSAAHDQRHSTI
ncbi:hypothetical protein I5M70_22435 [Serratia marcescens]|nr:hypothetical protein [Klebsiella aerogenes]EKT0593232.1 hypothetical protein [Morganella morganii]ELL0335494.1 hypothetical protein [Serratia marcescens]ELN2654711.1 hypothetical protein [Citrobacter braakii]MBT0396616.1 hypothetical protein [Morganella morganii subsp. morganii]MCO4160788.1 hypothetical protein [Citrobacter amalonaticus]